MLSLFNNILAIIIIVSVADPVACLGAGEGVWYWDKYYYSFYLEPYWKGSSNYVWPYTASGKPHYDHTYSCRSVSFLARNQFTCTNSSVSSYSFTRSFLAFVQGTTPVNTYQFL